MDPNLAVHVPDPPPGADYDLSRPVGSFIDTGRRIVTQPVQFFAGLPRGDGYRNPLAFGVICTWLATLVGGAITIGLYAIFLLPAITSTSGELGTLPDAGALVLIFLLLFVALLALTPVFAAFWLFFGAGIYHLLVMLIVGSANAGYRATFRAVAYASLAQLGSAVPFVGSLATIYNLFLIGVGIRELHRTTTARAAAVVLVPVALVLLLIGAVIAIAIAVIVSASGSSTAP